MRSGMISRLMSVAAGASMLLCTTAVSAAAPRAPQLDPLAVFSAMSSSTSAAILCGASTASASAAAGVATQVPTGGCVLPVVDEAAAAALPPQPIAVAPVEAVGALALSPLFLLLGAVVAAAVVYAVASGGGGGNNNPVSPA